MKIIVCRCGNKTPDLSKYKRNFKKVFCEDFEKILICSSCDSVLDKRFELYNNLNEEEKSDLFDHLIVGENYIIGQPYEIKIENLKKLINLSEKLEWRVKIRGRSEHSKECFSIIILK